MFHYESFYDFYSGYLNSDENKKAIEGFFKNFNERHFPNSDSYQECYGRISNFNRSYNQLLASLLHKPQYFEDSNYSNYPPYDSFISFLKKVLTTYDVKVHTLNHDLFFDWLGHAHIDLWQNFADGYKLEGSPYYGTVSYDFSRGENTRPVHKTYYVKLEQFCNEYDKPLCLFKLHGSIFNKIAYPAGRGTVPIRLKANYAVSRFMMEVKDSETGLYCFEQLWDEPAPDFLSGTTNKTLYYTGDEYYLNLFKHFEANLSQSEVLFVIGYGFQDGGINEYLEKYFLTSGKKMIVINPVKPKTELIDKYSAVHIAKGITDIISESQVYL